ncbi:MAG: hypothetical protein HZC38_06675 [Chloroflexi bacterium]|nr:hypothetical protein [Chloroflexota bacterium]
METLKKIWAAWKRFGQFIGDIVGRIVLTLLYFTIVLPFGVGVRLFSDPLKIKRTPTPSLTPSFWHPRQSVSNTLEEARRQ